MKRLLGVLALLGWIAAAVMWESWRGLADENEKLRVSLREANQKWRATS